MKGNGMDKREKITVIVPCYNEEESISAFYRETTAVLSQMEEVDYELLFVDDGSRDRTLDLLRQMNEKDRCCRYLSFSRNFGKEAAMYAGLSEASGDYCVMMDADLQHPPKLLPLMYEAVAKEGYDCCGGKRCGREGDGALRSWFSVMFYKVAKRLTHMEMDDGYGDFRMMKRNVVDAILSMEEYNRYMKGIFSFVGFRTKWISFENVERENGSSKWNFKSLLSYAMEGILSFSTAPLKLAGGAGALLLLGGLMCLLVNGVQQMFVPGALSSFDILLAVILMLAGMQMEFLYIIGLYLAKDFMENKRRPIYIVRERGKNRCLSSKKCDTILTWKKESKFSNNC